jgi:hypothetical protein
VCVSERYLLKFNRRPSESTQLEILLMSFLTSHAEASEHIGWVKAQSFVFKIISELGLRFNLTAASRNVIKRVGLMTLPCGTPEVTLACWLSIS